MAVTGNVIRILGRYSEGLRLAAEHGPTSGLVLEYAFDNLPKGSGAVGRLIDRTFLHLGTWDSVRQRMQTTKDLVAEILTRRRSGGLPTMILDVASGTGRYLRELARERGGDDLVIACHDRDPRQVTLGRQLIKAEALPRFTFSVGDATDHSSYLTSRDPDIVLAIDLFPLLHRDEDIRTVLRLAFEHLAPGGSFLCTTLARAMNGLAHWDTDAFRMRPALRQPEAIADWLRAAGFVHIDQRFSQPEGFALIGSKPKDRESGS
jgi:SAM-dependent methyltransferase